MTCLTVQEVADFLQISPRRVRALLAQGRILGFKDSRNIWRISVPFRMTVNLRGPRPGAAGRVPLASRGESWKRFEESRRNAVLERLREEQANMTGGDHDL